MEHHQREWDGLPPYGCGHRCEPNQCPDHIYPEPNDPWLPNTDWGGVQFRAHCDRFWEYFTSDDGYPGPASSYQLSSGKQRLSIFHYHRSDCPNDRDCGWRE